MLKLKNKLDQKVVLLLFLIRLINKYKILYGRLNQLITTSYQFLKIKK